MMRMTCASFCSKSNLYTNLENSIQNDGEKTIFCCIGSSFDTCNQNTRIFRFNLLFFSLFLLLHSEKQSNGSVHFDQQNISAVNKMSSKIRNLCILPPLCWVLCSVYVIWVSMWSCIYFMHVCGCACASLLMYRMCVYLYIYKYTYCLGAFAA